MSDYRNFDTQEAANRIYSDCVGFDGSDYAEQKEQEIEQIEQALFNLKQIALNSCNNDYWRTLVNALCYLYND